MKVLFPALRVSHLETSLAFYTAVGFELIGQVGAGEIRMAMLALPTEAEVSLELVRSTAGDRLTSGALDHLAVQVDDLESTRADLIAAGLDVGQVTAHGGPDGPHTATVVDPDGNALELVQWPPGHPTGMSRADFAPPATTPPQHDRKDAGR